MMFLRRPWVPALYNNNDAMLCVYRIFNLEQVFSIRSSRRPEHTIIMMSPLPPPPRWKMKKRFLRRAFVSKPSSSYCVQNLILLWWLIIWEINIHHVDNGDNNCNNICVWMHIFVYDFYDENIDMKTQKKKYEKKRIKYDCGYCRAAVCFWTGYGIEFRDDLDWV